MNAFAQSLLFALAAAFANILGGVIVSSGNWAYRSLRYFVALGSGFMLGTVFLEMLPESLTLTNSAPVLLLVGYLIVHTFEHTFASHLHFGVETHHEEVVNPIVGISALIGMIVHTFFDGVAIGAGFMISRRVGILIFLAVLLHKIPDGFTIASIVITSGHSKGKALAGSSGFSIPARTGRGDAVAFSASSGHWMQNVAQGTAMRRFSLISSPQRTHSPYSPRSMRFRASCMDFRL